MRGDLAVARPGHHDRAGHVGHPFSLSVVELRNVDADIAASTQVSVQGSSSEKAVVLSGPFGAATTPCSQTVIFNSVEEHRVVFLAFKPGEVREEAGEEALAETLDGAGISFEAAAISTRYDCILPVPVASLLLPNLSTGLPPAIGGGIQGLKVWLALPEPEGRAEGTPPTRFGGEVNVKTNWTYAECVSTFARLYAKVREGSPTTNLSPGGGARRWSSMLGSCAASTVEDRGPRSPSAYGLSTAPGGGMFNLFQDMQKNNTRGSNLYLPSRAFGSDRAVAGRRLLGSRGEEASESCPMVLLSLQLLSPPVANGVAGAPPGAEAAAEVGVAPVDSTRSSRRSTAEEVLFLRGELSRTLGVLAQEKKRIKQLLRADADQTREEEDLDLVDADAPFVARSAAAETLFRPARASSLEAEDDSSASDDEGSGVFEKNSFPLAPRAPLLLSAAATTTPEHRSHNGAATTTPSSPADVGRAELTPAPGDHVPVQEGRNLLDVPGGAKPAGCTTPGGYSHSTPRLANPLQSTLDAISASSFSRSPSRELADAVITRSLDDIEQAQPPGMQLSNRAASAPSPSSSSNPATNPLIFNAFQQRFPPEASSEQGLPPASERDLPLLHQNSAGASGQNLASGAAASGSTSSIAHQVFSVPPALQGLSPLVLGPHSNMNMADTGSSTPSGANRVPPSLEALEAEAVVKWSSSNSTQIMDMLDRLPPGGGAGGNNPMNHYNAGTILGGGGLLEPLSEAEEILLEREHKCQAIIARLELERDMLRYALEQSGKRGGVNRLESAEIVKDAELMKDLLSSLDGASIGNNRGGGAGAGSFSPSPRGRGLAPRKSVHGPDHGPDFEAGSLLDGKAASSVSGGAVEAAVESAASAANGAVAGAEADATNGAQPSSPSTSPPAPTAAATPAAVALRNLQHVARFQSHVLQVLKKQPVSTSSSALTTSTTLEGLGPSSTSSTDQSERQQQSQGKQSQVISERTQSLGGSDSAVILSDVEIEMQQKEREQMQQRKSREGYGGNLKKQVLDRISEIDEMRSSEIMNDTSIKNFEFIGDELEALQKEYEKREAAVREKWSVSEVGGGSGSGGGPGGDGLPSWPNDVVGSEFPGQSSGATASASSSGVAAAGAGEYSLSSEEPAARALAATGEGARVEEDPGATPPIDHMAGKNSDSAAAEGEGEGEAVMEAASDEE